MMVPLAGIFQTLASLLAIAIVLGFIAYGFTHGMFRSVLVGMQALVAFVVTLTLLPCGCVPTAGGARVSCLSSAGRAAYRGLPFALVGLILVAFAVIFCLLLTPVSDETSATIESSSGTTLDGYGFGITRFGL